MTSVRLLQHRTSHRAAVGAAAVVLGFFVQPASAQDAQMYRPELPQALEASADRQQPVFRDTCDRAYPRDEWQACGTQTGGPVGGRN
jgi:hypothetical protein